MKLSDDLENAIKRLVRFAPIIIYRRDYFDNEVIKAVESLRIAYVDYVGKIEEKASELFYNVWKNEMDSYEKLYNSIGESIRSEMTRRYIWIDETIDGFIVRNTLDKLSLNDDLFRRAFFGYSSYFGLKQYIQSIIDANVEKLLRYMTNRFIRNSDQLADYYFKKKKYLLRRQKEKGEFLVDDLKYSMIYSQAEFYRQQLRFEVCKTIMYEVECSFLKD